MSSSIRHIHIAPAGHVDIMGIQQLIGASPNRLQTSFQVESVLRSYSQVVIQPYNLKINVFGDVRASWKFPEACTAPATGRVIATDLSLTVLGRVLC